MEQPQNNSGLNSRDQHREPSPAPPLSPIQGFLLCLALLVGAGLVIHFTAGSTAPPAPLNLDQGANAQGAEPIEEPDRDPARKRLTNAQALRRFEKLDQLRLKAFKKRDPRLLSRVFTSDSPIAADVNRGIKRLKRDGVFDATTFDTKKLEVEANAPSKIEIRQVVVIDSEFLSAEGEDVTVRGGAHRETIKWWMRLEGASHWRIHDALVVAAKRLGKDG